MGASPPLASSFPPSCPSSSPPSCPSSSPPSCPSSSPPSCPSSSPPPRPLFPALSLSLEPGLLLLRLLPSLQDLSSTRLWSQTEGNTIIGNASSICALPK